MVPPETLVTTTSVLPPGRHDPVGTTISSVVAEALVMVASRPPIVTWLSGMAKSNPVPVITAACPSTMGSGFTCVMARLVPVAAKTTGDPVSPDDVASILCAPTAPRVQTVRASPAASVVADEGFGVPPPPMTTKST